MKIMGLFQYTDNPESPQTPKFTAAETVDATVFPRNCVMDFIVGCININDNRKLCAAKVGLHTNIS